MRVMHVKLMHGLYAIARLDPGDPLPAWARGSFVSITRTPYELSVVCEEEFVPDEARAERGWRVFMLEGPIPFEVTGVASALIAPLAANGISVFLVSTFDTDYLLVKAAVVERATTLLSASGFEVTEG